MNKKDWIFWIAFIAVGIVMEKVIKIETYSIYGFVYALMGYLYGMTEKK